jgi:hypothetical protein
LLLDPIFSARGSAVSASLAWVILPRARGSKSIDCLQLYKVHVTVLFWILAVKFDALFPVCVIEILVGRTFA